MINAGIEFGPFDGFQYYNDVTGEWQDITSIIHYPDSQNDSTDPVTAGCVIVEPNGQAWRVNQVSILDVNKSTYRLNLYSITSDPSSNVTPGLGQTTRGGIIQPINGQIAPWWDLSKVAGEVGRICAILNYQNMGDFWRNDVDLGHIE